ncbi:penicillin-binding protein 1C [Salmonella enterica subsp. diarizonae]|nr:penicillin-binding protein 1C [Salmonella enterica subsp. diarizonae]
MSGWRGKRGRWLWLAVAPFFILLALWAADNLWPLPLNEVHPARVVVAHDGTPLWRFADAGGIWRYPVTIEEVSPPLPGGLNQLRRSLVLAAPWR